MSEYFLSNNSFCGIVLYHSESVNFEKTFHFITFVHYKFLPERQQSLLLGARKKQCLFVCVHDYGRTVCATVLRFSTPFYIIKRKTPIAFRSIGYSGDNQNGRKKEVKNQKSGNKSAPV